MLRKLDKETMLAYRLDGMTYQAIAVKARISRQRVQQLLSPPTAVRQFIVDRANGRCNRCGVLVGKSGHVHHNGNSDTENYQDVQHLELLCLSCHRNAHHYVDIHSALRKTARDGAIINLHRSNPNMTLVEIGRQFGITRSRVCQILKRKANSSDS